MRKKLTAKFVENIKYKGMADRDEYFDSVLGGFALRVTKNNHKSFVVFYRVNGRQIKHTIGSYPRYSLEQAKKFADDYQRKAEQGIDPRPQKNSQRKGKTFGEVAQIFYDNPEPDPSRKKRTLSPATIKQYRGDLDRVFFPAWKTWPIDTITRDDIDDELSKLKRDGKLTAANSAYRSINRVFNWAVQNRYLTTSPCVELSKPAADNDRDRVLSDDEIKAVWEGCEQLGYPFGPLFQLMLILGRREGVTSKMRWSNIHLNKREWHIPKQDDKSKTPHSVPLPLMAINLLKSLPRFESPYVFTTTLKTPVSGFSKAKANLDKSINIDDWWLHDIRRTVRTKLSELQVTPDLAKLCIGHTVQGIDATYDRYAYFEERRAAIAKWSMELQVLIADEVCRVTDNKGRVLL